MTVFGHDIVGMNLVIIGWPTSGKTYLSKKLVNDGHVIIHTDDYIEKVGDFKQELYVLLDDIRATTKPVIIEGVLGYRLLRKGVELNCFYPDIVIELKTTMEQVHKIYQRERQTKDWNKLKGWCTACDTVLADYKAMTNPRPPIWIEIKHYELW